MSPEASRRLLRAAVSVALLAAVGWWVDVGEVVARLADLRPGWVAAAVVISVLQVVVSAWRWRYTAGRLGLRLPMARAVREYYLATFLNQVLPGGVVGDVSRAWRHAHGQREPHPSAAPGLSSVHAVVLERASGQAVMSLLAAVAAMALLLPRLGGLEDLVPRHPLTAAPPTVTLLAAVALAILGGWALRGLLQRLVRFPALGRLVDDARTALLGRALPIQAAASLGVVASYVAVFVCGARALGLDTPVALLALLAPPVLVSMLVPVSVAGWGLREGAAAVLWGAVGLSAADGVAVSVAYGLLVLVSSLPGAATLLLRPPSASAPDRTGGRPPAGSV